jgi:hypothetical protein
MPSPWREASRSAQAARSIFRTPPWLNAMVLVPGPAGKRGSVFCDLGQRAEKFVTRHSLIWLSGSLLAAGAVTAAFALGLQSNAAGFLGLALTSMIVLTLRDVHAASRTIRLRQEALRQVASDLEFSYRESIPRTALGWPESFFLLRDRTGGLLSQCSNVMQRSFAEAAVAILDYECDTAGSELTTRQTVFSLWSDRLAIPHFALIPASSRDRLLARFRDNAVLSNGYRAISGDADRPERIDHQLFAHLGSGTCLEAGEGVLLLYRKGVLAAPDEIADLITSGLRIFPVLCRD